MLLALIASLALLLPTGAEPAESARTAAVAATTSADVPSPRYKPSPKFDFQGEDELLALTNRERRSAGAAALHIDPN